MKHSQDPNEPHKWASGVPETDGLFEAEGVTGREAEIRRGEDLLLEVLGRPESRGEAEAYSEPRSDFGQQLRARFLDVRAVIPFEEHAVGEEAMAKLRAWSPDEPSAEFRERLRESFLAGNSGSRTQAAPLLQHGARTQRAPKSISSRPSRLRLVAFSGVLAAAAAALLLLRSPSAVEQPTADGSTLAAVAAGPSAWELDTSRGDVAALLASVRIDGKAPASMDDFRVQIATASRVESVGADVRIRYHDDFVMELGAGSTVLLDGWTEEPVDGESRVLFAQIGSVRIATGPGFESIGSMELATPHVRMEVTGTIFGLDVAEGYTCICCLEGSVHTSEMLGGSSADDVRAGQTWIANVGKPSPWLIPLIDGHRRPLENLASYWA